MTEKVNVVIPVLVHGKGIYDSDAMKTKYTGMVLKESRTKEMSRFEEPSQAYPDVRTMGSPDSYTLSGLTNTHVYLKLTPYRSTYGIYRREDRKARSARAAEHARTLLHSGVTTVRDTGNSMGLIGALPGREAGSEPGIELSRIQAIGMPLTPNGGHLALLGKTSNSAEESVQAVKERKSAGCGRIKLVISGGQLASDSISGHDTYSEGGIRAAVEVAHELGLPTAAYYLTTSSYVNVMEVGVNSVEHCACFRRSCRLGLLKQCYEPGAMEAFRGDHRYFMIGISNNYHQLDQIREGVRKPDEREAFLLEQEKWGCEMFGHLADLGICSSVGADAGYRYTFSDETWLEMELLCRQCGFTPEKAIHATTSEGARALGYGDFLGWLAPGYEANFIAVAQNSIQDIEAFRHIKHVVYRGKIIE